MTRVEITAERPVHLGTGPKALPGERVEVDEGTAKLLVKKGLARRLRGRKPKPKGEAWDLSVTGMVEEAKAVGALPDPQLEVENGGESISDV